MAENPASDPQNDYLTCKLCHLSFTHPKALPCLHTFCKTCLSQHARKHMLPAEDGTSCIYCPTCQQLCDMPKEGVDGLQDNELLQSLLDMINSKDQQHDCDQCGDDNVQIAANYCCVKCEDFLCGECATKHKRARVTKDHLVVDVVYMKEICRMTNHDEPWRPLINVRLLLKLGTESTDLFLPVSIATNKADEIIVSNSNLTLSLFSMTGECKKTVEQRPFFGENDEEVTGNKTVSVTAEGYLAVAMKTDKATAPNGTHVAMIQSFASREINSCFVKTKNPETCQPHGIAVTNTNHVIVTDIGKHCVYIFDPDYKLMKTFGKKGSRGSKQFKYPYYVAVNLQMDIIISDYGNHCVKVFKFKGLDCVLQIGSNGTAPGYFTHPMGVCADRFGNIFVADRDNHRVQMFDPRGTFLANILEETYLSGQDIRPVDVTMTTNSQLVVLLRGVEGVEYSKIHIYQLRASRVQRQVTNEVTHTPVEELKKEVTTQGTNTDPTVKPTVDPTVEHKTQSLFPATEPSVPAMPVAGSSHALTKRPALLPPIKGDQKNKEEKLLTPKKSSLAPINSVQPDLVLQSIKESIAFEPDQLSSQTESSSSPEAEGDEDVEDKPNSGKRTKPSQACVIL